MLDLDPQGSLSAWWELRGSPDSPALGALTGGLAAALERLRHERFEFIIIDTPPALLDALIEPAIVAADLVLIPTQASSFDLQAVEPVVEIAKREGKPFAFVLNRVETRSKLTAAAEEYLRADGTVLAAQVGNREVFRSAITSGRSGPELGRDDKARGEIDALWSAVKKLAMAKVT